MNSTHVRLAPPYRAAPGKSEAMSSFVRSAKYPDVLLVEDSPDHAFLMECVWRRQAEAPRLAWVCDGQEAKEFLLAEGRHASRKCDRSPRLVISDLNMPTCGGLELLKWIREQPSFNAVRFVMFTSSSAEEDVTKAYSLGVDNYLMKPSTFSGYEEIVSNLRYFWSDKSSTVRPLFASAS